MDSKNLNKPEKSRANALVQLLSISTAVVLLVVAAFSLLSSFGLGGQTVGDPRYSPNYKASVSALNYLYKNGTGPYSFEASPNDPCPAQHMIDGSACSDINARISSQRTVPRIDGASDCATFLSYASSLGATHWAAGDTQEEPYASTRAQALATCVETLDNRVSVDGDIDPNSHFAKSNPFHLAGRFTTGGVAPLPFRIDIVADEGTQDSHQFYVLTVSIRTTMTMNDKVNVSPNPHQITGKKNPAGFRALESLSCQFADTNGAVVQWADDSDSTTTAILLPAGTPYRDQRAAFTNTIQGDTSNQVIADAITILDFCGEEGSYTMKYPNGPIQNHDGTWDFKVQMSGATTAIATIRVSTHKKMIDTIAWLNDPTNQRTTIHYGPLRDDEIRLGKDLIDKALG
jgi:hypothetical protein